MTSVIFIEANGIQHEIEATNGTSLMQVAINNMVPGIEGDCGGLCACATCHVYVPKAWQTKCGRPEELEQSILDFAYDVNDDSRLACQIILDDELDGITLKLPERQY